MGVLGVGFARPSLFVLKGVTMNYILYSGHIITSEILVSLAAQEGLIIAPEDASDMLRSATASVASGKVTEEEAAATLLHDVTSDMVRIRSTMCDLTHTSVNLAVLSSSLIDVLTSANQVGDFRR